MSFNPWYGGASVASVGGGGGGGSIVTSEAAPSSPTEGMLWWRSSSGQMFLRYDDQWIEVGVEGAGGSVDIGAAPNALTGSPPVLAWYKADAITGLSDGDAIASWPDSGPNGYGLSQGSAGSRPTYRASSGFNGMPAAYFDGVDDFIRNGSTGAASQVNLTAVVVASLDSNANCRVLDVRGSGFLDISMSGANWFGQVGPPVSLAVTSKYNTHMSLIVLRSNGTRAQLHVGGHFMRAVETGSGAVTPSQIAIGNDNGSGSYFKGWVAEVVLYGAYLTHSQMRQLSRHLGYKYGFPVGVPTP